MLEKFAAMALVVVGGLLCETAAQAEPMTVCYHVVFKDARTDCPWPEVEGAELRSGQLRFAPDAIRGGTHHFAIGSAGLTALALLVAYVEELRIWIRRYAHDGDGTYQVGDTIFATGLDRPAGAVDVSAAEVSTFVHAYDLTIMNPSVLIGMFTGAMIAFVFCAMTMKAVGRAAGAMVDEVRRQFQTIAGIMTGEAKPDYARCVAISTAGAQREMVLPAVLALSTPIVVGIILGVPGVFGLLIGTLVCGFTLAIMLNNAGGAWDNAKKYIEKGNFGGKGSEAHKAGVVGDTVGDPFKDTSGPSLNILIKIMSMVSVVFAGVVVAYGDLITRWFG